MEQKRSHTNYFDQLETKQQAPVKFRKSYNSAWGVGKTYRFLNLIKITFIDWRKIK